MVELIGAQYYINDRIFLGFDARYR